MSVVKNSEKDKSNKNYYIEKREKVRVLLKNATFKFKNRKNFISIIYRNGTHIVNLSQINVSYVHLSLLNRRATLVASFDRANRIVTVPGGKIIGISTSPKVSLCTCLLAHAMRHGKSRYSAAIGLTEAHRCFHDASSIE